VAFHLAILKTAQPGYLTDGKSLLNFICPLSTNLSLREGKMPALNRVQLIGYLGKDPETRQTPAGRKVTSFSVAVNRRWHADDGQSKEATDWFNVDAWGRLGEICQQYLCKGSLVFVEGRLQTNRYEQDGETRYFTRVVALQMQILDRKVGEPELDPEPADFEAAVMD
jgi:single-strand DNA-binding protein